MPFGYGLPEADLEKLYAAYRQAGGNSVDSAHCYCFWKPPGAGASEKTIGKIIKRARDRKDVLVITKGGHPAVPPDYPRPDKYLAPEVLASDIATSLNYLQMDYVDLYFLHRDDSRVPVSEIIDVMNQHISAGRIRAIGASNWSTARTAEANQYAGSRGLAGFVASQPEFNLAQCNNTILKTEPTMRYITDADLDWHTKTKFPVFAYSPAAFGYFATGGTKGSKTYDNPTSRARLARAQQLAAKRGRPISQVALAYLLSQPFPTIPIIGTADPAHVQDSFDALSFSLSPEELRWLRQG